MLDLALVGPVLAQEEPPAVWAGRASTEVVASSVETRIEVIKPGQVFARQVRRPTRSARLGKDFPFGEGQYAGVVKAGTMLYGENFMAIPRVGETLPPRRKDDLTWCVSGRPPLLCFRWNGPGDMEYSSVFGEMMFLRAPAGDWRPAHDLEIVEQTATPEPPYEDLMVLKVVGENGFVISNIRRQGEVQIVENETHYWDELVDGQRGAKLKFRLSPVKNSKGEVTAARTAIAP
jgi:hypothetical protein